MAGVLLVVVLVVSVWEGLKWLWRCLSSPPQIVVRLEHLSGGNYALRADSSHPLSSSYYSEWTSFYSDQRIPQIGTKEEILKELNSVSLQTAEELVIVKFGRSELGNLRASLRDWLNKE